MFKNVNDVPNDQSRISGWANIIKRQYTIDGLGPIYDVTKAVLLVCLPIQQCAQNLESKTNLVLVGLVCQRSNVRLMATDYGRFSMMKPLFIYINLEVKIKQSSRRRFLQTISVTVTDATRPRLLFLQCADFFSRRSQLALFRNYLAFINACDQCCDRSHVLVLYRNFNYLST